MDFYFAKHSDFDRLAWFFAGLRETMVRHGHTFVQDPDRASLVVNPFPRSYPKPFRRRGQAVFLIGVTELGPALETTEEALPQTYPLLIRSLSNLLIGVSDSSSDAPPDAHFITPEQGHYRVNGTSDLTEFFDKVYERIEPLATSRLIIDNVFRPDLPEQLWKGDELTRSMYRAGKKLDALNVLPIPFPLDEILPAKERRHLKRLYGIGGLSYGNISARYDATRFWMSASGVDKSNLKEVGRDIQMVAGYDEAEGSMLLSVPPGIEPRRVSVDAIEHWMIYREHPSVGAILHVHAWMDGIPSTEFNYPCGTFELGKAVAEILRGHPEPAQAVVGLKNHGLTITGLSLDEIFERIGEQLIQAVPMS